MLSPHNRFRYPSRDARTATAQFNALIDHQTSDGARNAIVTLLIGPRPRRSSHVCGWDVVSLRIEADLRAAGVAGHSGLAGDRVIFNSVGNQIEPFRLASSTVAEIGAYAVGSEQVEQITRRLKTFCDNETIAHWSDQTSGQGLAFKSLS